MKITAKDKIALLGSMYSILYLLPSFQKMISALFRPIDNTRFYEFAYLKKFIQDNNLCGLNVLDISSPHMMAYLLSKKNNVVKTNIDIDEKKFIKENKNLSFKIEDAIKLSFSDNSFDLVYSISVIEHIYEKYVEAISEMIRVTKSGGYIYLTFPVAEKYKEEWRNNYIYSNQFSEGDKTFFYYRFSEKEVVSMLNKMSGVRVVQKDIFWEKTSGLVDSMTEKLNIKLWNKYFTFIKDVAVNMYYGFTVFGSTPQNNFPQGKHFGVVHLIFKKD